MKLCVTAEFLQRTFAELGEMDQNYTKSKAFWIWINFEENWIEINFHWILCVMKIYILCCVPTQILYWEKSCSWDMGQNTLSQSHRKIFESTISSEQIDKIASFFVYWYKLKAKSWSKSFWLSMVKNGCGQYGLWTLKLTVTQEWIDGINWFFGCWNKFMLLKCN